MSDIACLWYVMNVEKVHQECYLARQQVLVTVYCSNTFVVGAPQKYVFYRSFVPFI